MPLRDVTRILVIDHLSGVAGGLPEGLAFVMDGGLISDAEVKALELSDPEILSVALLSVDEAALRASAPLRRRITVALDAVHAGQPGLCENGRPLAR